MHKFAYTNVTQKIKIIKKRKTEQKPLPHLSKKLNDPFASMDVPEYCFSFVTKGFITALKLFTFVCCCGWQGWKWIEASKNWLTFSCSEALSSKNCQKLMVCFLNYNFVWYLLHSFAWAFCVWVKLTSKDLSMVLTLEQQNSHDSTQLVQFVECGWTPRSWILRDSIQVQMCNVWAEPLYC